MDDGLYYTSIVIGVRGANGWTFYQQSYDVNDAPPLPVAQVSAI